MHDRAILRRVAPVGRHPSLEVIGLVVVDHDGEQRVAGDAEDTRRRPDHLLGLGGIEAWIHDEVADVGPPQVVGIRPLGALRYLDAGQPRTEPSRQEERNRGERCEIAAGAFTHQGFQRLHTTNVPVVDVWVQGADWWHRGGATTLQRFGVPTRSCAGERSLLVTVTVMASAVTRTSPARPSPTNGARSMTDASTPSVVVTR